MNHFGRMFREDLVEIENDASICELTSATPRLQSVVIVVVDLKTFSGSEFADFSSKFDANILKKIKISLKWGSKIKKQAKAIKKA